jgi:hypothetical protein
MALINKNDLKYNYNWSTKPASKSRSLSTESSGETELLSANEGEEVLSFINDYADLNNIVSKEEALRIESLLQEKLKENEITRDEAREWLDNHLKSKKN